MGKQRVSVILYILQSLIVLGLIILQINRFFSSGIALTLFTISGFLLFKPNKTEIPEEPIQEEPEEAQQEDQAYEEVSFDEFSPQEAEPSDPPNSDVFSEVQEKANKILDTYQAVAVGDTDFDIAQSKDRVKTMKDNSNLILQNSQKAFDISDNLANTAKQAFELSEKVQTGIKLVTQTLGGSLEHANDLFEQSQKISKIVDLMSDISSKTHVLSINASIVSARAGTHGKGFEVVAKEIRKLAQETDKSLQEIEELIEHIQKTISVVAEKTQSANSEITEEKNSLLSVAGSLQGVILAVEIVRTVSSVAQEKSTGQNKEIDAVSESLDTYSQRLQELTSACNSLLEQRSTIEEIAELCKNGRTERENY